MTAPRYFVFDVESIADGDLVSRLRYAGQGLSPRDAVQKYRDELMAEFGNDFVPYTYQVPLSITVGKVSAEFRLMEVAALDEPKFRSHIMTQLFWRGWEYYKRPTLVSFNGRTFDIPLLELAAFRYGLSLPQWFNIASPTYEQSRNRYNINAHIDLQELVTNFGSSRFSGGLHLAANLLGKPGKMDVEGHMVQDLYNEGKVAEINDYCRCDVLDTYFVFLRTRVLLGQLTIEDEQRLVNETKEWLQESTEKTPVFGRYLERWGDWPDPWTDENATGRPA